MRNGLGLAVELGSMRIFSRFSRAACIRLDACALAAFLPLCVGACTLDDGDLGESSATESTGSTGDSAESSGIVQQFCESGAMLCSDDGLAVQICSDDGQDYEFLPCGHDEICVEGSCLGPCALAALEPSAAGCAFTTMASANYDAEPDGLMVTNISDVEANVKVMAMAKGSHDLQMLGDVVTLAPGQGHLFSIAGQAVGEYSMFFTGGSYRLLSDQPVVVQQQAPLFSPWSSDTGLLVPDHALGLEYVIASYPAIFEPSYFTVVAVEDRTRLHWTPPVDSAGSGLPIPFVAAGETGEIVMLRGDTLRIGASAAIQADPWLRDLSGTVVWADKPIVVVGSSRCAQVGNGAVSANSSQCDHLYEPMMPLRTWGRHYIGTPAPSWQEGPGVWRVVAGDDGVTVTVEVEGAAEVLPLILEKRGDFAEIEVDGAALSFTGDGSFMPVYYLHSGHDAGDEGDPSMIQMAPVEQYQRRYAFSTGVAFDGHVVQIVRSVGGAPVQIDDAIIDT
ncbi:MAG TPA: hypothetical protein ENK31_07385, partial [Nannocystis exedens]|nr:hypothetical protein [Nannocystis exedens]